MHSQWFQNSRWNAQFSSGKLLQSRGGSRIWIMNIMIVLVYIFFLPFFLFLLPPELDLSDLSPANPSNSTVVASVCSIPPRLSLNISEQLHIDFHPGDLHCRLLSWGNPLSSRLCPVLSPCFSLQAECCYGRPLCTHVSLLCSECLEAESMSSLPVCPMGPVPCGRKSCSRQSSKSCNDGDIERVSASHE